MEYFVADRRGSWKMYQIILAPGVDGKHKKVRTQIIDNRKEGRENKLTLETAVRKTEGGYVVETFLPWSNLPLKCKAGDEVAVQTFVNDVDGDRQVVVSWHPQTGTFQNPNRMRRVVLGPREGEKLPEPESKPKGEPEPAPESEPKPEPEDESRPEPESEPEPKAWTLNGAIFAAAPIPAAGRILVPVMTRDSLSLAAIDPENGALLWRTPLCSLLFGDQGRSRPVGLAAGGSTVFVCTGEGVLGAVDAADGAILWLTGYRQNFFAGGPLVGENGGTPAVEPIRRDESAVFPHDDQVIVVPADSNHVEAFDQSSGQRRYAAEAPFARYAVGVDGERLYLAGIQCVAALDLANGRELWRRKIDRARGRAVLTDTSLLVPCGNRVLRLDPASGEVLAGSPVQSLDGVPVGNLYTVPGRLIVAALDRIELFKDGRVALAELDAKVEAGNAEALARRGIVHLELGKSELATADLRRALRGQLPDPLRQEIRGRLFDLLLAAAQAGDDAVATLDEAESLAEDGADRTRIFWQRSRALQRSGKAPEAAQALLRALAASGESVASLDDDHLVSALNLAAARLERLASDSPDTVPAMREAAAREALADLGPEATEAQWLRVYRAFRGTRAAAQAGLAAAERFVAAKQAARAAALLEALYERPAHRADVRADALAGRAAMAWELGWKDEAREFFRRAEAQRQVDRATDYRLLPPRWKTLLLALGEAAAEPERAQPPLVPGRARLLWKKSLKNEALRGGWPPRRYGEFRGKHVLLHRHNPQGVRCLNARTGETVWNSNAGYLRGEFHVMALLMRNARGQQRASQQWVDLTTGKALFAAAENNDSFLDPGGQTNTGAMAACGDMLAWSYHGPETGTGLQGADVLTGKIVWQRKLGHQVPFFGGRVHQAITADNSTWLVGSPIVGMRQRIAFRGFDAASPLPRQRCHLLTGETLELLDVGGDMENGREADPDPPERLIDGEYILERRDEELVLRERETGEARGKISGFVEPPGNFMQGALHRLRYQPPPDGRVLLLSGDGRSFFVDLHRGRIQDGPAITIPEEVNGISVSRFGDDLELIYFYSGNGVERRASYAAVDGDGRLRCEGRLPPGYWFIDPRLLLSESRYLVVLGNDPKDNKPPKEGVWLRNRAQFIDTTTGEIVPDAALPRLEDVGTKQRALRFSAAMADGPILVFSDNRHLLAYDLSGEAAPEDTEEKRSGQ